MFPIKYFPIRYFTPKYWPPGGGVPIEFELILVTSGDFNLLIKQLQNLNLRISKSIEF